MPVSSRTPNISLRLATPADADRLSTLAVRTFVDTFGHLYPRSDLDSFLAETYSIESQRALVSDPKLAIWLLDEGTTPIGYALAGPCTLPHPDVSAHDGELKRLYIIQSRQGRGLGAHLMQAALDWLLRDGQRTLWLGVWSENHAAQRFYARYGFAKAGEYLYQVGHSRDHELIFKRPPQMHPL